MESINDNAAISPPLITKSPNEISSSTYLSINRWSIPSYLPQTRVIFLFLEKLSTRFWVRGFPCGEKFITTPFLSSFISLIVFASGSAEPLAKTIKEINEDKKGVVINFSPQGKPLTQNLVESFSRNKNITLVCGRYEGIDQRFIDKYVDEEISLGDFVMSGGEIAALSFIDSIIRILPGTLGNPDSVSNDTFSNGMLKGHSYTS